MSIDKNTTANKTDPYIDGLFNAGSHIGYGRSRRHPLMAPYIFGAKDRVEIFDLEKTKPTYLKAEEFLKELGATGKMVLFLSSKLAAKEAILKAGRELNQPYVAGRWVGGTLTNFKIIRSRVDRYLALLSEKEKGELTKYTKKERLMIDREIDRMKILFGGIVGLSSLPSAIVLVDPKEEHTAVREAARTKVPIAGILGSDCDPSGIQFPVIGNDSSRKSISHFIDRMIAAYKDGNSGTLSKAVDGKSVAEVAL